MSIVGNGIDMVEIDRIERMLDRQKERFLKRVFTDSEAEYCLQKARPAIHFAARFAAKEAVAKALGTGFTKGVRMRDIEVVATEEGSPRIRLHGGAARRYCTLGASEILISLTHTREHALAHAVIS